MRIFFSQIPDGYEPEDYPDGTEFAIDDSPRQRDPITFRLIRPPKLPLVYPEDINE